MKIFAVIAFVMSSLFATPMPCPHAMGLADIAMPADHADHGQTHAGPSDHAMGHATGQHAGHDPSAAHDSHAAHAGSDCSDDCGGGIGCDGCTIAPPALLQARVTVSADAGHAPFGDAIFTFGSGILPVPVAPPPKA